MIIDDYTIEEFCKTHEACEDGRKWAVKNCASMQEAWEKLPARWLIWVATCEKVLSEKELRLFAVHCARTVAHLLTDNRLIDAISVAERHAEGQATDEELLTAEAVAWTAAMAASWAAEAAEAAAWTATMAAAGDAKENASYEHFAAYLRANTTPNFSKA